MQQLIQLPNGPVSNPFKKNNGTYISPVSTMIAQNHPVGWTGGDCAARDADKLLPLPVMTLQEKHTKVLPESRITARKQTHEVVLPYHARIAIRPNYIATSDGWDPMLLHWHLS